MERSDSTNGAKRLNYWSEATQLMERSDSMGRFASSVILTRISWNLWLEIFGVGSLAWNSWLGIFGLASLAWNLCLGMFGLGSFASYLCLGIFGLEFLAWDLWLGIFRANSIIWWNLWLDIFGLRSFVWDPRLAIPNYLAEETDRSLGSAVYF